MVPVNVPPALSMSEIALFPRAMGILGLDVLRDPASEAQQVPLSAASPTLLMLAKDVAKTMLVDAE